jgi:hypothetical protein
VPTTIITTIFQWPKRFEEMKTIENKRRIMIVDTPCLLG